MRVLYSNWNLEGCFFQEGGKPEYPEKNPRAGTRTNNKLNPHDYTWPKSNPGHIGERRALSSPRHSCSPKTDNERMIEFTDDYR